MDQPKTGMDYPSGTKSHPAWSWSLSDSQLGWPPCWTSPLAFGLFDWSTVKLAYVFLLKSAYTKLFILYTFIYQRYILE